MRFVDYSLFEKHVKNYDEINKKYHVNLIYNPHCPDCQKNKK
jgi:hypothetical protein